MSQTRRTPGATFLAALIGVGGLSACNSRVTVGFAGRSSTTTTSSSSSTGGSSSTAGASTTGSSSGTTTGVPDCGAGLACFGDQCLASSCEGAFHDEPCGLPDGGAGICAAGACRPKPSDDDPQNCGALGASCPTGSHCAFGGCVSDENNEPIFSCSNETCPGGEECLTISEAMCVLSSCAAGDDDLACLPPTNGFDPFICCGSACIDPTSDPENCGGCGLACEPGMVCYQGGCLPTACAGQPAGTTCLADGGPATCCGSACTSLLSDLSNCGVCGMACPHGDDFLCDEGECLQFNHGILLGCGQESPCPAGWSCLTAGGFCVPDCALVPDGVFCGFSAVQQFVAASTESVCCNHRCVDLGIDPNNCGTCGRGCDTGEACLVGACEQTDCSKASGDFTPCVLDGGGGVCCGGQCSDVKRDPLNCGSCRTACPLDTSCDGSCQTGDAGAAETDCRAGCPAGTACVGPENICRPTSCGPNDTNAPCVLADAGAETTAFGVCCGGACVNPESDLNNCGACGLACGVDGGCLSGFCNVGAPTCGVDGGPECAPGLACATLTSCEPLSCAGRSNGDSCFFGMSDGPTADIGRCCDQRCVDLSQDPQNCGACGVVSPSGLCPISPNEINCISQACADLSTDPQHCGSCLIACPAGQTCSGGTCSGSPSCGPGRDGAFCEADAGLTAAGLPLLCCPGFGCLDATEDNDNCGSCGNACPGGQSCADGTCH